MLTDVKVVEVVFYAVVIVIISPHYTDITVSDCMVRCIKLDDIPVRTRPYNLKAEVFYHFYCTPGFIIEQKSYIKGRILIYKYY